MATANGRMVDVSNTVQARRVEIGACPLIQVFEGQAQIMLTGDALAVLGQVVRDEGVGFCTRCDAHTTLTASQAERRFLSGRWQWICPSCRLPLEPFPF